ncbi:MAG: hypothetical protein OEM85_00115 [Gammaproteobacteria bacterium]|nr:hypothetical protein [Gammaproteobacteria bacterium]
MFSRFTGSVARAWALTIACAPALAGCDRSHEPAADAGAASLATEAPAGPVPTAGRTAPEAWNMALVGRQDLQGRPAYHSVAHNFGDRTILFVGHHAGEAMNPMTNEVEVNGLSVLDVTDPGSPELLLHRPPTSPDASHSQHVQICDGAVLPNGDPDRTYLARTDGNLGYEIMDVTDPTSPQSLSYVGETGVSPRPESQRGSRETHKLFWDCESGIGYFNGTADGWLVTRLLQAFDLSEPEAPRHIRDFGLDGWQPGAEGPMPAPGIGGLHQPFVVGDRVYLGYESGANGVIQILDRDKLLNGDPSVDSPMAPTTQSLRFPQIARVDMPSYWGAHTAKPIFDVPIPDYSNDRALPSRDLLIVPSEVGGGACLSPRDVVFIMDITDEAHPFVISTYQADANPGDFCSRGGRFGPHSINDAYHPAFDKRLMVVSYFSGGIRAVDIRNPFRPVEVGYFVPEVNETTAETCSNVDGTRRCKRVIQTNNVDLDSRGYIFAVDRAGSGLHIVELTGAARDIVGL